MIAGGWYEGSTLLGGIVQLRTIWLLVLCGLFGAIGLEGCSSTGSSSGGSHAVLAPLDLDRPVADLSVPSGAEIHLVAQRASPQPKASKKKAVEPEPEPLGSDEDFYDPFARDYERAAAEEYDPWERLNTKTFEFNRQVDKWVLKPVAQGYNFVVPDRLQVGIHNFFYNVRFPSRFFNNLFQGKWKGGGIEVSRFLINSTFGLAGFIDVAERMDLTTPEEDTGQTLGVYGVKPGPYLIVPFLPPFTVRDFVGYLGDIALNPINWLVFPIIEIEGVPSVVSHSNRNFTTIAQLGTRIGDIINERSLSLEKFQGVEEATLDLYAAVRNAYLQARRKQIRE